MIAQCAAALTATVLLTTGSLAVEGRAPVDHYEQVATAYADDEVAPPTAWMSFRDAFEIDDGPDDDEDANEAPRGYDQRDRRAPVVDEVPGYRPHAAPAPTYRYGNTPYDQAPRPRETARPSLPPPALRPQGEALGSYQLPSVAPPSDGHVHVQVDVARNRMLVTNARGQRFEWKVSTAREGRHTMRANNLLIRANPAERNYVSKKFHSPMPDMLVYNRQYMYAIHGTTHEEKLGKPASMGCVRLSRAHARTLFDWTLAAGGARVTIR